MLLEPTNRTIYQNLILNVYGRAGHASTVRIHLYLLTLPMVNTLFRNTGHISETCIPIGKVTRYKWDRTIYAATSINCAVPFRSGSIADGKYTIPKYWKYFGNLYYHRQCCEIYMEPHTLLLVASFVCLFVPMLYEYFAAGHVVI